MRTASLLIVASAFVTYAHAGNLKSEILQMNKKVCAALSKNDMKTFEKLTRAGITKDFVYTEAGKNMTFDEMLAQMKGSMGMMSHSKFDSKLTKLVQKGDKATATSYHSITGLTKGQDKKDHKMVMSGPSIDSYVKVKGVWKMSRMNWVSSKMTLDGKPMNMAGG